MKKLLKVLLGKPFIITLAIVLQVAFLVGLITFLENGRTLALVVAEFVGVVTTIVMINRDMTPEGKVTWAVAIMTFPIAGVLMYFLFSQNRISFRQYNLLRRIQQESNENLNNSAAEHDKLKDTLGVYFGQSSYLWKACNMPAYAGAATKYFPSGESFWQDLLAKLRGAEEFIFLEYFIIERGVMWDSILEILLKKVAAGVEVRVMYDDIGSINTLPSNYGRKLQKMGIKCVKFNRFTPLASAVHNNRDHRKMAIIDGVVGYVGGMNLADEYINVKQRFGYWKDSAVRLTGRAVDNLTAMFLQMYNLMSRKSEQWEDYISENSAHNAGGIDGRDARAPQRDVAGHDNAIDAGGIDGRDARAPQKNVAGHDNVIDGVVMPFADGPRPIYPEQIAEQAYLNIINQAEEYLYITTPYLILDERLKAALTCAAKRGVDVTIVTPHIPDKKYIFKLTRYNYRHLQEAGVKVYEFSKGFIHAKSIIADDCVGIVGTINLDYRSLVHHYECGVWMYKTAALVELKEDIEATLSECQLQGQHVLGFFDKLFCKIAMILTPLM
jgi:cardiolipin synthase